MTKNLIVRLSDGTTETYEVCSYDNANYHMDNGEDYRFQTPYGYLVIPKINVMLFTISEVMDTKVDPSA